METFSFSPPIHIVEEGKWLLGVTSFEATNSFFDITEKKTVFQLVYQVVGEILTV